MIDKDKIIKLLRAGSLDFNLMMSLLDLDEEDELLNILDEMIKDNIISYNENNKTYKLNKGNAHKHITREEALAIINERKYIRTHEIKGFTKIQIKELMAELKILAKERIIVHNLTYDIYSVIEEGIISTKNLEYGFIHNDIANEDYYVRIDPTKIAYNGDLCQYYFIDDSGPKKEVAIKKILKRANTQVIGLLKVCGKKFPTYYINSTMKNFPVNVVVDKDKLNGASIGDIVCADLNYSDNDIFGAITKVLGNPNDPGIEISQIALEFGFEMEFSDETIKELDDIKDYVSDDEIIGRKDFRNLNIITIDGDDSKDYDDAVYLEKLENGTYSLGVYIADVADYVKEGTSLDKDALKRGTSVYLADRVIPMLPRKLSNGICSLNEGVDRKALACIMEFDIKGKLINYDICECVINSHHRMTYNNVNKILNGDEKLINEYSDIYEMLINMNELSKILRALRFKKGGLDFDSPEYKFTLNEDGSPKEIIKRDRNDSEMLIEDFMLAANETVAYHMNIMNLPIVYRIHEKPDQEKLHTVFGQIAQMGVKVKNIKNDIHPKEIQGILGSINDNPNKEIINNMLLRSMMKAKYSNLCLGHYGLAMNYYCHFTSPIRRYPDLMTHRMIKNLLLNPRDLEADIVKYNQIIPEIALKNSLSERKAVDCERAVDDMLFAWYMSKRINNKYVGVITSITAFGMYVKLDFGVEGLLAFRNMYGYYEYNEKKMCATNGINCYKLGDKVEIKVLNANKYDRVIDFGLAEEEDDFYEDYMY